MIYRSFITIILLLLTITLLGKEPNNTNGKIFSNEIDLDTANQSCDTGVFKKLSVNSLFIEIDSNKYLVDSMDLYLFPKFKDVKEFHLHDCHFPNEIQKLLNNYPDGSIIEIKTVYFYLNKKYVSQSVNKIIWLCVPGTELNHPVEYRGEIIR
jgi:hypothetical protein